jgi:hypothetical protein
MPSATARLRINGPRMLVSSRNEFLVVQKLHSIWPEWRRLAYRISSLAFPASDQEEPLPPAFPRRRRFRG